MHSAGLELKKLTYPRLEDNLIRHRGDRHICTRKLPVAVIKSTAAWSCDAGCCTASSTAVVGVLGILLLYVAAWMLWEVRGKRTWYLVRHTWKAAVEVNQFISEAPVSRKLDISPKHSFGVKPKMLTNNVPKRNRPMA